MNAAEIAAFLGDAKPVRDDLLASLAEATQKVREHEHPTWEDLYCLNLVSYMGERMAPVLRRLVDAEARVAELEPLRAQFADAAATVAELVLKRDERMKLEHTLRDRIAELEAAPITVYRASHGSVPLGLYTSREAAMHHCEGAVSRDSLFSGCSLSWSAGEDGSAWTLAAEFCRDASSLTDYVVTAQAVDSAYDEEADE